MDSLTFLVLYAGLCLGLWLANVAAWRWAAGDRAGSGEHPGVGLYELAMLSGGPRGVVTAAVTALFHRGALCAGVMPGTLAVSDDLIACGEWLEPVEHEVLAVVRRSREIAPVALEREVGDSEAICRLTDALTQTGLLVAPERIVWTRLLWLSGPPVLFAVGAARLANAWNYEDEPMRWLLVLVIGVGVEMISHVVDELGFDKRPLPTARGLALVELHRERHMHGHEPDETRTAWSVALNGPAVLWNGDPALAALLGAPREQAPADRAGWSEGWGCG